MRDVILLLRIHITLIGLMGTMVFGWLLTDEYLWGVALLVGLDWLLVNLMNRISDIDEDTINRIPGTARAARGRKTIIAGYLALFGASLAVTVMWLPALTGWRLFMQATGMVYNFPLLPTPKGRRRLKEVYFLKNLMSGLGFVTTCFFYPLAATGYRLPTDLGWPAVGALIAFFLPFELTFEIIYDLRDVEGDRRRGVPTYPVVHGIRTTHRIIQALLLGSVILLTVSFFCRFVGARELLLAGGPLIQLLAARPMLRRGPSIEDCIRLTNLGWGLLAFFLVGTAVWRYLGLPANIFWLKSVISA